MSPSRALWSLRDVSIDLRLIDAIGPFFRHAPRRRLNWSKIPFAALERHGRLDPETMATVRGDFDRFCARVATVGFNAVTLDDLAHLARFSGYGAERCAKIEGYREEWRRLFEIARHYGLGVFLTTDVLFSTPELERHLSSRLSVFWDTILINHAMRQLLRALVRSPRIRILEAEQAMAKLRRMIELAPAAGVPRDDLVFQHDTFEILAAARRYYFGEYAAQTRVRLETLRERYEARYPDRHYRVQLDFRPLRLRSRHVRRLLHLIVRRQRGYRAVDRLVTLSLLRWVYPLLRPFSKRFVPELARETAMGIDTLMR